MYELYIILSIFTFLPTLGLVYIYIYFKDFNQFLIRISPFSQNYDVLNS